MWYISLICWSVFCNSDFVVKVHNNCVFINLLLFWYKYQELIPCFWEWRGNYQGIQTTNNGPPPVAVGNSYAIRHQPNSDNGVLCANPFGSRVNFSFILGADVE